MKTFLLACLLSLASITVAAAPSGPRFPGPPRPTGFAAVRAENRPTFADVLPAGIAERKMNDGGYVVASVETLMAGWKLRLLRYQEWNYDSLAWLDYERDSSIYDVNERIALLSARHVSQGVWENYYRFIYSYDADGNLIQFQSQSWYQGAWLNYVKYVYTYDAQGHQLSFTHIKWFSGDWQNVRRYTYTYDGSGNETSSVYELWGSTDWVKSTRTTYGYDEFSRRVDLIQQTWVDTAWVNSQRDSTTYNPEGRPSSIVTQYWNTTVKIWLNVSDVEIEYNTYGDESLRLTRLWMDFFWKDTSRVVTVYEPQGHPLTVSRQLRSGGQWVDDTHDLYAYDPYWNVSSSVTQEWLGTDWSSTIRYAYTYDRNHHRLTDLSQRWVGGDWQDKTFITRSYDEIGNLLDEMRQSWTGYQWLNIARYVYEFDGPKQDFNVRGKWNIVSVPLTLSDYTKTVVFPTATSAAFTFDQGYTSAAVLAHGRAYWLKFAADQSVTFTGVSRSFDTVDVVAGWNMVGALSTSLPVANIGVIPDSLVTGAFYGYGAGYEPSDTLEPARGYWVKASQAGRLVLDVAQTNPPANRIRIQATGELPPPPPVLTGAEDGGAPATYALGQNYPNPFNPSTMIAYALRDPGEVELQVYDLLGRVVAVLASGRQEAGEHAVRWNAGNLPSGIYFYRLRSGEFTKSRKLLLLR